jgi:allophanate hydrolase
VALADLVLAIMAGERDATDPLALVDQPAPRFAVFGAGSLEAISDGYRQAFSALCTELVAAGVELVEVDAEPFLAAGRLLYDGAFVAERYASVGDFITMNRESCDPTVAAIILAGATVSAADYVRDHERLERFAQAALAQLERVDALLLPTAPFQPTRAAVAADPVGVNSRLGVSTTFCNLLGMCAYAVPAGEADGGCFGVSLLAPGGRDRELAALASWVMGVAAQRGNAPAEARRGRVEMGEGPETTPSLVLGMAPPAAPDQTIPVLVVGAHLSGMELNHQLTELGAALIGVARTATSYRLYALSTSPPKPGLVRAEVGRGASIAGELWALSPAALGRFVAALPQPMVLGKVELDNGQRVVGFLCEPIALAGAEDITSSGGWRNHLSSRASVSMPALG